MFKKFHSNPFAKDPEAELARRLKHAKSLTREEFRKRMEEIQKKNNEYGKS